MKRATQFCHLLFWLFLSFQCAAESVVDKTKGMQHHAGFVDFYWQESSGKIYIKVSDFEKDFLYVNYLQSGVGSNNIGLDRGQIGDTRVAHFKRLGNKVLMVQPNQSFRAHSDNALERQAVADGFAQSVLWGGEIKAETEGTVLLDITDFLLRDSQGIAGRLTQMKEGSFAVDAKRSAVYMNNTKNFPDNTEFEALITLQGKKPGKHIRSVAPTSDVISVRTHHSFVRLPEDVMPTRKFDPRSGGIPITFDDYAAPLGEPMKQQWVIRHRLEKDDKGHVKEPIVYYLDSGTPEPVRSALLDGARWWSEAFEYAGFEGGFEVKMLPADADPLDVRYNTIQWVHRSTRGWSYGASIVDPRSGEILKGHVTLGSLRVRQDMKIAQALLSPFKDGFESSDKMNQKMIQDMALARLRQLSAHEVGHTLGLIHNFYASSKDRASVMDYPHPLAQLKDGEIDLSDAYATGMGDWDKVSTDYLYRTFENAEAEQAGLEKILTDAAAEGHVFIADRDARMAGGSHPKAHLWDNGADAAEGLLDVLKVREVALSQFGLDSIKSGDTVASLESLLAPLYLFHRYQVEAAVKLIAGVDYRYAIKGEADVASQIVDADQQQAALEAVLKTIEAKTLALPEHLLNVLLPPTEGSYRDREHFKHRTGLNFDMLSAAEVAADHSLSLLLNPARINRLAEQHSRNDNIMSVKQLLAQLQKTTWGQKHKSSKQQLLQDSINWVTLQNTLQLASDKNLAAPVKAQVHSHLKSLSKQLKKSGAMGQLATDEINLYFKGEWKKEQTSTPKIPPGSPIGSIK
ncbi:zinc-dependent metalloprotease [Marinicella rhabdoformis]|uniref:zinc-dependent metalloprotease n=1 Tax=Marinicella rhabdoformis TaxID=2580566 RepID=UPI0012AEB6E4|nr:zinc-dependent metalloprotease [Marinicella rhabdoformis]